MDSEALMWLQNLQTAFCVIFFSFAFFFSVFSLLLFFLRTKVCCDCDVCRSYLTSSWSCQFDNLCDWYTHLLRESPSQTIHIHVLGNTITANPDNVEYMLKTKFDNYPKGKPFSTILSDLLGRGIFNVDGDSWRFQRKMASLELGSLSIRSYASEIFTSEIQNRLLPLLSSAAENGGVVDLQDVFRRFAFDSICKFSFGVDPGCLELSLPISEFAMAFDLASKLSAQRALSPSPLIWKMKRFLNLGTEKQLKEAIKLVNMLANEVIKQRRQTELGSQPDLLSRFMGSVDDDSYLRDIVISFLLAGRDTVASALTSFFWLLAKHPEVEEAIRNESDRIMGSSSSSDQEEEEEPAGLEQMREMHYLHAAVYETMRLYPPVQFDSKFAEEDDLLPDGTVVRKGTRVTYHPYAMGRMEKVWGVDCLEFKPERWLKNGVFTPANPYKYPVFQAGLRVCLGKEMALMEVKSVALAMIRRFKLNVAMPSLSPKFSPGLTATVSGGLPVMIQTRRN